MRTGRIGQERKGTEERRKEEDGREIGEMEKETPNKRKREEEMEEKIGGCNKKRGK